MFFLRVIEKFLELWAVKYAHSDIVSRAQYSSNFFGFMVVVYSQAALAISYATNRASAALSRQYRFVIGFCYAVRFFEVRLPFSVGVLFGSYVGMKPFFGFRSMAVNPHIFSDAGTSLLKSFNHLFVVERNFYDVKLNVA